MEILTDTQAMGLALDKARKGVRGANPLVGAVIVDAIGQLLSTGWHRGTGTVQADNPQLTARTGTGQLAEHQPLRVVVGESALLEGSHLARAVDQGNALHYRTRDLTSVLTDLHGRGVRHLMVEGGPTLITALIRTNLVDELYWYRAPLLLGAGKPALGDLGITSLDRAGCWQLDPAGQTPALDVLGADTLTRLIPSR